MPAPTIARKPIPKFTAREIKTAELCSRALWYGIDFETALSTIYGVELMPDNVELCRERLLCGQAHLTHIVQNNIVCHDALTYDYRFGEPETFGPNGIVEVVK
jgi:hypothetical protein